MKETYNFGFDEGHGYRAKIGEIVDGIGDVIGKIEIYFDTIPPEIGNRLDFEEKHRIENHELWPGEEDKIREVAYKMAPGKTYTFTSRLIPWAYFYNSETEVMIARCPLFRDLFKKLFGCDSGARVKTTLKIKRRFYPVDDRGRKISLQPDREEVMIVRYKTKEV